MSFRNLIAKTWRENHLFTVLVELTYACNLDCVFCYNDLSLRGRPIRREKYFALLEELAGLQALNLVLSGGEPLLHKDFFDIALRGRELGFAVRVKTNGHALSGENLRRLAEEVNPLLVELSLHGANAATHERQTRKTGSFDRLLTNLTAAKAAGLRLKLNSTLTAFNEHEIEGMYAIADRLEVPLQIDPKVSPRDDGDLGPTSIAASAEGLSRLLEIQERRGRTMSSASAVLFGDEPPVAPNKHCGAGSSTIAIDPWGDVFPCVAWRKSVGNVHDRSLAEIWQRNPALDAIRATTAEIHEEFSSRPGAGAYGFCPGAAYSNHGDPKALYPAAISLKSASERRARLAVVG